MSALDVQEGGNHYKDMAIQPVEFITRNHIPFLEGCVIKRMCRWRNKAGLEDLRKALHEIQILLELEMDDEKRREHPKDTNPLRKDVMDVTPSGKLWSPKPGEWCRET